MSRASQTHPNLFTVCRGSGDFSTSLKARTRFAAGSLIAPVTGVRTDARHYTTVQCGPSHSDNIRIVSDIVYVNHSCEPNTAFDLSSADARQWHVRALRDIAEGDDITFFYPSTEWEMDQAFKCHCGTRSCLGTVKGAKYLTKEALLERGYVNPWILRLLEGSTESLT